MSVAPHAVPHIAPHVARPARTAHVAAHAESHVTIVPRVVIIPHLNPSTGDTAYDTVVQQPPDPRQAPAPTFEEAVAWLFFIVLVLLILWALFGGEDEPI